jgi:SNF2 family DNA or RNA helicase
VFEESSVDLASQDLDLSQCRFAPYDHQVIGIRALIANPVFALFDEMGAGKTLQVIVAAQILFRMEIIDRVLILVPASLRDVWFDIELGELSKHLWDNLPSLVSEYRGKIRNWRRGPEDVGELRWVVTNYEFIRDKDRIKRLKGICGPKTLLVLDESSAIKNRKSLQTKACKALRKKCGRIVLLNGTPISNSPSDMFSQGQTMSPDILDCPTPQHFRSRYAVMGGFLNKQVVNWINLDDLQERFAPYVLRRLKKDCLDLPEKLPSVVMTVPLSPQTWAMYKEMRDEMVAWLTESSASAASQAIVKAIRLAQITSGYLGGVQQILMEEDGGQIEFEGAQEIGHEKQEFVSELHAEMLKQDPDLKLLIWCRFKPELFRLIKEAEKTGIPVGRIVGGQKREERLATMKMLHPDTAPPGPCLVGGTYGTGGKGHNFSAAHTVVNMSYDYSLEKALQSADRVHRPGQIHPVSYFDIIATGPQGQKTIDHHIVKARRNKENIANLTTSAWVSVLREE